jgi:hypothetical protein
MRNGHGNRGAVAIAALLAWLAVVPPALAAGDVASREAEARGLILQGDFIGAARAYHALRASTEDHKFLFNEALARQKAGQFAVALALWEEYSRLARPRDDDLRKVQESIEYCRPRVFDVAFLRVPSSVTGEWYLAVARADDETARVDVTVRQGRPVLRLDESRWVVTATMAGKMPWRTEIEVFPGGPTYHEITFADVVVAQPTPSPVAPDGLDWDPDAVAEPRRRTDPPSTYQGPIRGAAPRQSPTPPGYWWGAGLGGTALVAGAGLLLFDLGRMQMNDPERREIDLRHSRGEQRLTTAWSLIGAGVGGLSVGLTGLLPPGERPTALWSELGVGGALVVTGGVMIGLAQKEWRDPNGDMSFVINLRRPGFGLLLGGVGLSLGAGLALLLDDREDLPVHISLAPLDGDGGTGLFIGGRF